MLQYEILTVKNMKYCNPAVERSL